MEIIIEAMYGLGQRYFLSFTTIASKIPFAKNPGFLESQPLVLQGSLYYSVTA